MNEFERNVGNNAFELLYGIDHNLDDDFSRNIDNHTGNNNVKNDCDFHDLSSVNDLKSPVSFLRNGVSWIQSITTSDLC
jgi:hypothetical protein